MVVGVGVAGFAVSKILPAIGGVALKVIPALGVASSAAAGAGKIAATIGTAVKAATALIGVGKIAIIPFLIATLAYYHYDAFDPENRPFNVKEIDHEYDFIVVGGGLLSVFLNSKSPQTFSFVFQRFRWFSCRCAFVRNLQLESFIA